MKKLWIGFLLNLQFFTSIPIHQSLPMDKAYVNNSVKTFPLLGLLQGMIYVVVLFVSNEFTPFSVMASAFIMWLMTIIVTGGLHLDGWMDTSDAFFSYQEPSKRLEIMKDPRVGAFGVLSVIILLSTKLFFIFEIVSMLQKETYWLILFLPFFSKILMGLLLIRVKEAKEDGLGAFYKSAVSGNLTLWYMLFLIVGFILFGVWNRQMLFLYVILLIVCMLFYCFAANKAVKWYGGLTGDVLGASVEGTELVLWGTIWLLHYFVMG